MKIGSRYKTQDGRWAHLIAIDAKLKRPLVFRVGDEVWTRQINGRHCDKCDGRAYPSIPALTKRGNQ